LGKRPAVVAVDFSNGFTHSESPLGGNFEPQIAANLSLIKTARLIDCPIFFTTVIYDNDSQASVFRQRVPALNILQRGSNWVEINPKLADYVQKDRLIEKHFPSAFFATDLANRLKNLNTDTLLITGLTTSGCVRATCVDALQHNFATVVVEEACGDRNQEAHRINLHDMHAKYAQVMSLEQSLKWLNELARK